MRRRFMGVKEQSDLLSRYMAIEAIDDVTVVCRQRNMQYSRDGKKWYLLIKQVYLEIRQGETVYFKNVLQEITEHGNIELVGSCRLKGNCMSLIFGDNAYGKTSLIGYAKCFQNLFLYCNIVSVDDDFLPATEVADYCYNLMFSHCTRLIKGPILPASKLQPTCYAEMYKGCTNLNYIKMLATDISADGCLTDWVSNVASSGTFVKHPDMVDLPNGINGIPNGWKVVNDGEEDSGGIDTTLKFPLYLNFDYCEETFLRYYCYGSGDYAELNRVIKFVIEMYGEDAGYYNRCVDEAKLDELGLEIYVEGEKVRNFNIEYDTSFMQTDTYYSIQVNDTYIQYEL